LLNKSASERVVTFLLEMGDRIQPLQRLANLGAAAQRHKVGFVIERDHVGVGCIFF